ncbi:pentatricopeptide repeat-containing protein At3g48250, chloroplastic [Dendrobium catenatum]|uniref:Pentatricopeptide repeat-containing protein n=1 Tax=Dendrobium catenatum TaxID=906689 RepID=A0A2I0VXU4_9ASPA|nr:pentatricopeptide repeat-containing protein At3g48250, chloroplastic [Dendrobium catenatum]PKU68233.1 Pentatricopeptide repeat-containing protein [Dendrobium catenatum]
MLPSFSRLRLLSRRPLYIFVIRRPLSSNLPPCITSLSHSFLLLPYSPHSPFLPHLSIFPSPYPSQSIPFSSIPESSDLNEFSSLTSVPTPESIIYVIKKLDKVPQKALDFFNFAKAHYALVPGPSAYNLMLRILAHKDFISDFWVLLNSMQKNGYKLDEGAYRVILGCFKNQKLIADSSSLTKFYYSAKEKSSTDAAVKYAAKIVLDAQDWSKEVEKNLEDLKSSVSEELVAMILRELRDYPHKALVFFAWASGIPDYQHGSVAHNAMALVLGRDESIGEFWSLVKEMRYDMDIDTYVKVTRQFLKRKMMKDAVELYEFMMDGPYKPAIQDCGLLLRQLSLSSNPDLDLVFRVVKKYEAVGYSLSKVVYDGIHRSLTSTAKFEEAMEIMQKMRQEGYEPDNITYSQLVYGLCKTKRLDDASNVLDEMEKGGCTPDLKTWTILIHGYCSAGDVDGALECLTKMIGKNYEVDADLLDVLVNGLCGKKRTKSAYTLMVEMIDNAQLRPWQSTYKYLIKELLGVGKLEEALKLLSMMKNCKVPPFIEPFAAHIAKFGTIEDAKEFLKILAGKTYPSSTTYVNLFKAFFDQGRYTEAQDLLFKCPHHIRKLVDISKLFGSVKGTTAS